MYQKSNHQRKVKSKKKTVSNDARNDDNIDITNANGKETEQIQNWENTMNPNADAARFSSKTNGSSNLDKSMDK